MSFLKNYKLSDPQVRFIKFGILGGFTTVFGLFLYYIFLNVLHIDVYTSYPIVFVLSVTTSYLLNTYFSYKVPPNVKALLVFFKSYIFAGIVGFVILFVLKKLLESWDDFVIVICVVALRALLTFFIIEFFLFSRNKDKKADEG